MAGITLGNGAGVAPDLRSITRNLIFEASADTGLVTVVQLDEFLNLAHRELYNQIVEWSPSMFAKRSADKATSSTVAGQYSYAGTALDADGVHRILFLELKNTTNQYLRMSPINYIEGYWPGISGGGGTQAPYRWASLGQAIMLEPEPAQVQNIRITYVPGVPLFAAITSMPFGGDLQQFHELVAKYAALIALEKDKAPEFMLKRYNAGMEQLQGYCRRRQAQRSRHVNRTAMMDDDYFI